MSSNEHPNVVELRARVQRKASEPASDRASVIARGLRVGMSGLFKPENGAALQRYIEALRDHAEPDNLTTLQELGCALIGGQVWADTAPRAKRGKRK